MDLDFSPGHAIRTRSSSDDLELLVDHTDILRNYNASGRALAKSCDRCYSQKLKCSRNDAASSRCVRCQRAGLRCSYSTRFAKQTRKTDRFAHSVTQQKSSQMLQQQPLPSPGLGARVPSDVPISDEFDFASLGTASSAISDDLQQKYLWPLQNPPIWSDSVGTDFCPEDPFHAASSDGQVCQGHLLDTMIQEQQGNGSEDSRQSSPLHELACLSRRLEDFFQAMSTAEPTRDLHSYPIGETFDGSQRLLGILRQHKSRTTNTLLALHCYILCVKILARLCEKLLAHLSLIAQSEAQVRRRGRTLSTPEERLNNPTIDDTFSIPFHSDLCLGELHSHLDPFGHVLDCVCGALSAGFKLLKGIETTLSIPTELGVSYESLLAGTDRTDLANDGAAPPFGELPTVPSLDAVPRAPDSSSHPDLQDPTNRAGVPPPSLSARLIAVLWDEEAMLEDSAGAGETALAVLRRCSMEIYGLARQRAPFPYQQASKG